MKVIGVTGGVGSGKSEILRYMENRYGARIMMADDAARELERPGMACYEPLLALLKQHGGDRNLTLEDGEINRKEMAFRIFTDPELLSRVNAIVHPAVWTYIEEDIERCRRENRIRLYVVEAALLIECGYGQLVDEMWYIHTDMEVRRQRLKDSRGYSDQKIDDIMASQLSEEEFRRGSDVVIDNSGTLEETKAQIDKALRCISEEPDGLSPAMHR